MSIAHTLIALIISSFLLTGCGSNSDKEDKKTPEAQSPLAALGIKCMTVKKAKTTTGAGTLTLNLVDTYVSGNKFDTSSAEIVSYDSCSDKLYVVNSENKTVDVLSLGKANSAPAKDGTIDLSAAARKAGIEIGAANSVSAKNGLVAVAIEARVKQDDGLIALYRSDDLSLLATYAAGALPDMVTLSEDARYILTANEGEPSGDYKSDPEGSVTIVDLKAGFESGKAIVKQVGFTDFNKGGSRAGELGAKVRISGPDGTSVAQDLEPEYLALGKDGKKAFVALQENNALAIIDVASAKVDAIKGLGEKSWNAASGNTLDVSNKDKKVGNFQSYENLVGLYMPDTITSFEKDGKTYIVSANEGDGREYIYETTQKACEDVKHIWDGSDYSKGGKKEDASKFKNEKDDCISFTDEVRAKDLSDVKIKLASDHPLAAKVSDKKGLGRLKLLADQRNSDVGKDDNLVSFGARSFSIWDDKGTLVYDSGDDIAKKVFAADNANFNSTNDKNNSADNRSDDKGTEPEAVEVATINGRIFAFVGLERQGGVIIYDITNPKAPVYQSYLNNRDFTQGVCTDVKKKGKCKNDTYNPSVKDLGPESIDYFSRLEKHYIAVGNEVSGTTTVYEISFK